MNSPETRFIEVFRSHRNVIAWNCRMPHSWLVKEGQNVLHIENALLSQKSGMFADHRGFFSKSNLCRQQSWQQSYAHANPEFFSRREFGWEAFTGGCSDGPVLVALQCRADCNLKLEFPMGAMAADKVVKTLELLQNYLPHGRPVLIRPHPRERDLFTNDLATATGGCWRDDWTLDMEGTLAARLPQCSALVTVNSTCASEAALLGIPTATLGTGAFTGSGVTLECAEDPTLLAQIPTFTPDLQRCRAYTCAILGRHFLPYDLKRERPCLEFENWLEACQEPSPAIDEMLRGIESCAEVFHTRPHIWHRYLSSVDSGVCMEFGVFKGRSINYMAEARPLAKFHGFDSFAGLPEDWIPTRPAGYFNLNSSLPSVRPNVTLYKGWFEATLPKVASEILPESKLQAVHIDCDLGSSTATVLRILTPWLIRDKPVILFDEFIGYPGFQSHEIKAFCEWASNNQVGYKVLGKTKQQVLLELIPTP